MAKINCSDPAIQKALDNIRDPNTKQNWVVVGYKPKSTEVLKVLATGEGGVDELKEELNDGKAQYAYICVESFKTRKFVYIAWCGEGVTGILKGSFPNHAIELANFILKNHHPIHVQINARNEDDLEESEIKERVKVAFGSNFDAGKANQGISEGIASVHEGAELALKAQQKSFKTAAQLAAEKQEIEHKKHQKEQEELQKQLKPQIKKTSILWRRTW